MWITRTSIRQPVFATMVMVGITVLGIFSYDRLKVEQMPDVSLPFVLVMTNYPGAAPEAPDDVEGGLASAADETAVHALPVMAGAENDQVVRRIAAALAPVADVVHFETGPRGAAGNHAAAVVAGENGMH